MGRSKEMKEIMGGSNRTKEIMGESNGTKRIIRGSDGTKETMEPRNNGRLKRTLTLNRTINYTSRRNITVSALRL
jgi:hypothetical protein